MDTSKKLEISIINSQRKSNHINSIVYPEDKLLRSRYHMQKILQLQAQNANRNFQQSQCKHNPKITNHSHQLNTSRVIQQIQEAFINKNVKSNPYCKAVSTKPIVSNPNQSSSTLISTFQQSDYPLENHQKVQVCHDKVFQIKNYYNYLYDLAIEEHKNQLNQQSETIKKIFQNEFKQKRRTQIDQEKQRQYDKSLRQSVFQKRTALKRQQHILDPQHFQYQTNNNMQNTAFNLKQKDRLRKSKGAYFGENNSSYKGNSSNMYQNNKSSNFNGYY